MAGLQEELQATTKRHAVMMSVHTEDIAALRREVNDLKRRPSQETGKAFSAQKETVHLWLERARPFHAATYTGGVPFLLA